MNNVLDRWETCPADEKRLVICQYLDDVKKNTSCRSYSNPADFDAEVETFKKLKLKLDADWRKHQKAVSLIQLKEHRFIIGMLKVRSLMWDKLKPLKHNSKSTNWFTKGFESRKEFMECLKEEKRKKKSLIWSLKQSGVPFTKMKNSKRKRSEDLYLTNENEKSVWIKEQKKEYKDLEKKLKCASDEVYELCDSGAAYSQKVRYIFDYLSWAKPKSLVQL
ncbi:hypothetical protein C5167_033955 [Papaver somniferum]|uniref:Uncharacterized protein n=1 Tax=Papaver somniferum TaxID=3469 RepID=A0A4Y7KD48_PAPSO|nr:uncharacterized protein LOC113298918 [Papaver somniferum]RZC70777.1 hypothetical protein C5167_033955 [Papaver somniferum]